MMGLSVTHILLVLAVALLLFGRGKISGLMGDLGKGIRSFKKELADNDEAAATPPRAARLEAIAINTPETR
jgi:sec-independent protein translocase protein TatA